MYVALGSSFAAGPGIAPMSKGGARRSERNYAHQVAAALSLRLVDVTSSGATTANILTTPQWTASGRLPPQIEAVTSDTRLVTVTVGGNDIGYIQALVNGSLVNNVIRHVPFLPGGVAARLRGLVDYVVSADRLTAVATSLADVVHAVRVRAPESRIVLVDYLTVLGTDARQGRRMPLPENEVRQAAAMAAGLAEAFERAGAEAGADVVKASVASAGHGVGSPEPWVTDFHGGKPYRWGWVPYHPTLAGMAAVAELVVDLLSGQPSSGAA